MLHLDLFSGIGGFAYAADQVWPDTEHIFCDTDQFCRQVLKKHWPESEIHDDIRRFTKPIKADILTGGFPCQPFSAAGLRRGTDDDRYLWPEMLRVIRLTEPDWVIAENVRGLLTLQQGMVFEQMCLDLEASGYEVQPFIIPAVAVNAPHRRDRVWFVACNATGDGRHRAKDAQSSTQRDDHHASRPHQIRQPQRTDPLRFDVASWNQDWFDVATELCRVDDGLPEGVGRTNQLKAYDNAIVPQVAIEIMRGIALAIEAEARIVA